MYSPRSYGIWPLCGWLFAGLHYTVILHPRLCALMASASWVTGFHLLIADSAHLPFTTLCGRNKLDHFFLWDPSFSQTCLCWHHYECVYDLFCQCHHSSHTVSLIMFSYGWIVRAVLRMKSTAGGGEKRCACGSHLTVSPCSSGTAISVYFQPSSDSQDQEKFMSLSTLSLSLTNPLIYTLRNRDVKERWRRCFGRPLTPDDGWGGQFNGRTLNASTLWCICVSHDSLKFPLTFLKGICFLHSFEKWVFNF